MQLAGRIQRACLEMLEKWVTGIQFPELNGTRSPQTVKVPSLFGAIEQFESARYPALGHWARKNYDRAVSVVVGSPQLLASLAHQ